MEHGDLHSGRAKARYLVSNGNRSAAERLFLIAINHDVKRVIDRNIETGRLENQ